MKTSDQLAAQMEAFDSFWEGPEEVEKGYRTLYQFYKHNYLKYLPSDKNINSLLLVAVRDILLT